MITKETTVNILENQMPYLMTEYGVKNLGVFGSVARNQINQNSDIDIVVEFDRPIGFAFMDLADHLEQVLQTKVDLLTFDSLDTIRVQHVAQSIRENIVYVPTP